MINLIDVGGARGLQDKWERVIEKITPIIFEPNPAEAEQIRQKYRNIEKVKVIAEGLYSSPGSQTLNITQHFGCISIRRPNEAFLRNYPIGKIFEMTGTHKIECKRYDQLFREGIVPTPDFIKIDVQSVEYEVLEGFGELLDNCIGIELEAHLYPIYEGQKLLGDLVEYLHRFELMLSKITPVNHFESDIVEVDAIFLPSFKRRSSGRVDTEKLKFVKSVVGL
jgi:FkbM family methyltransferase